MDNMKTAKGLLQDAPTKVLYEPGDRSLRFACHVTDVRNRFGNIDYKVVPEAGMGERWVPKDHCIPVIGG